MANEYIITLKRPSYTAINLVSVILIILFLVTYSYVLFHYGLSGRNLMLLLIPMFIVTLLINGLLQSKRPDFLVYYRTELFIAALGWFLLPAFASLRYIGWAYALMAFIERFVKYPDQWAFSKEQVLHLVIPRKKFEWVEIENVIIRDNLFTLDLRNNRMIQKELDVPVDKATQDEFNDWCRQQLHFDLNNKEGID